MPAWTRQCGSILPLCRTLNQLESGTMRAALIILSSSAQSIQWTASIERIDYDVLQKITDRILKEVKNVNRVCYDLSPKPTATIEWE